MHELRQWFAFERVFGPLTVQERVDVAGAIAAWASAAAAGSKAKPEAFMPDWQQAGEKKAEGQTPEDMIAMLRAVTMKR